MLSVGSCVTLGPVPYLPSIRYLKVVTGPWSCRGIGPVILANLVISALYVRPT